MLNTPKDLKNAMTGWIFVKVKSGHLIKIQKEDILVLEADDNCTHIHTADKKYCVTRRIGKLAAEMAHPGLVKVHKSYFIQFDKIQGFVGSQVIVNKMEIPVSRSILTALKKTLNI